MNNRVGHLDPSSLERIALGTDGIGGDLFTEAQAAFWRAREVDPDLGPSWVLERLASSARFAGVALAEPLLGTLEPGAPADFVVLDYRPPTPLTDDNLAGHWVYGLSSRMVRDVYVAGDPVVTGRRLTRVDAREVWDRSAREAERLWARMEEIDEHPFDPGTSWE
jgi:cytosine/adenosine deaminase-related metal-dependent hydrolase